LARAFRKSSSNSRLRKRMVASRDQGRTLKRLWLVHETWLISWNRCVEDWNRTPNRAIRARRLKTVNNKASRQSRARKDNRINKDNNRAHRDRRDNNPRTRGPNRVSKDVAGSRASEAYRHSKDSSARVNKVSRVSRVNKASALNKASKANPGSKANPASRGSRGSKVKRANRVRKANSLAASRPAAVSPRAGQASVTSKAVPGLPRPRREPWLVEALPRALPQTAPPHPAQIATSRTSFARGSPTLKSCAGCSNQTAIFQDRPNRLRI
jgi:hypothetical protein